MTTNNTAKKTIPFLRVEDFNGIVDESEIQNESYRDKFKRSIMNQAKEYPLPVPVINLSQNGETIPFLTLKSFSLWQGKQKSKKTTVLALAVAAVIYSCSEHKEGTQFTGAIDLAVILFFDNEQGESYAARTMKLILKLANVETSIRLIYCDLREFSPDERKKIIEAGIECTPGVKLVVIDGLVDLLNDFMDAGEGHLTTTDILKLCSKYNIHIAGVLHQNKNDKNARAHIGTISSQKCEMEISTEVDPDDRAQSIVTCVNSRGIPFEPFAIRWDKGSLPCINQDWNLEKLSDTKSKKKFEQAKEIAEAIFKPLTVLSHTQLVKELMSTILVSESTAKRHIKAWVEWKLIVNGDDGNYRNFTQEVSRVHEGSNGVHEPVL